MSALLKKISVKNIVGTMPAPKVGEEIALCVIMGYAKSYAVKQTTYGDCTAFSGDFKGIDVETGEDFRSGMCYLPDVASDLLKNALDANPGIIEFGFDISVVGVKGRTEGEQGKYEYRCRPLMKAAENDPMLALENKLAESAKEKVSEVQAKVSGAQSKTVAKKGGK